MNPKEKAKELYLKFLPYDVEMCDPLGYILEGRIERHAKHCAFIAAEEARQEAYRTDMATGRNREQFWYDVIQELEAL